MKYMRSLPNTEKPETRCLSRLSNPMTKSHRRRSLLWAAPLILLSACSIREASYTKPRLVESVKELCKKEYNLDVDSRLVGRTLYVSCVLDGLVGHDLGLQGETLDKLEGAMLSATRVALSTDAEVNFLLLKARDSRLG